MSPFSQIWIKKYLFFLNEAVLSVTKVYPEAIDYEDFYQTEVHNTVILNENW